ncbi:unnamed protein product [Prorocentrum cordatum]|uniref:Uncharacterized protein n=1 Tax=Prorocentrum cordatum TaxID=2364126 RepID=A0ABN9VFY4_9DINO|nr:unnamed protein product [Polarella glacialis]
MADLMQTWRNMPDIGELFEETAGGDFVGCEVPSPRGTARFVVNRSAISESMRWFWAYDEETLALFDELASRARLVETLGKVDGRSDDLMLYAGSLIDAQVPPCVHRYRPSSFVAFDGRLKHRTQPFEYARAPAGAGPGAEACCDAFEAGGHLRVLVSLAFGSSDAGLARYNHKMLRKQTCHEEALIRQSPQREVDIDSELDTSASDPEPQ